MQLAAVTDRPDRRCWSDSRESASPRCCAQLVPESDAPIGELIRDDEGRHTTTASRLYQPAGRRGDHRLAGSARFRAGDRSARAGRLGVRRDRDDSHRNAASPIAGICASLSCAVRAAVEAGAISARRYESYRRLRRLYERLSERSPAHARSGQRMAPGHRVRQRAAIDVLELPAHRHAVRNAAGAPRRARAPARRRSAPWPPPPPSDWSPGSLRAPRRRRAAPRIRARRVPRDRCRRAARGVPSARNSGRDSRRLLDRHHIGRGFNHADQRGVALRIGADRTQLALRSACGSAAAAHRLRAPHSAHWPAPAPPGDRSCSR